MKRNITGKNNIEPSGFKRNEVLQDDFLKDLDLLDDVTQNDTMENDIMQNDTMENDIMQNDSTQSDSKKEEDNAGKRHFFSNLISALGVVMIVVALLLGIVTTIPDMMGYEIYQIVSGSMEPEISVGSAVFIKECEYEMVNEQDIIAFVVNDSIVVHRVIKKDGENRWLFTKGDANEAADMNPVSETQLIGKMTMKVPVAGSLLSFCTSKRGKVYLMCFVFAGVFINYLGEKTKKASIQKNYQYLKILWVVVFTLFALVMGYLFMISFPYLKAKSHYNKATTRYVTYESTIPSGTDKETECPVTINFDQLKEQNPEIVGWIYCEDTNINYPVCQGSDDEYYLSHSYDGTSLRSGSIFMETQNAADLSNCNTILYGHHMKDGSMFASLSKWSVQRYYESHDIMWYLTKDKTYQLKIFASFVTLATSDTYTIYGEPCDEYTTYLQEAMQKSYIVPNDEIKKSLEENPSKLSTMILSTCDYSYKDARFVLYGILEECR